MTKNQKIWVELGRPKLQIGKSVKRVDSHNFGRVLQVVEPSAELNNSDERLYKIRWTSGVVQIISEKKILPTNVKYKLGKIY